MVRLCRGEKADFSVLFSANDTIRSGLGCAAAGGCVFLCVLSAAAALWRLACTVCVALSGDQHHVGAGGHLVCGPCDDAVIHFDQEIKRANTRKKNLVLLAVIVLQLLLGAFGKDVLVYSLLAVLAGVTSVYIEILQQRIYRKKDLNEQT